MSLFRELAAGFLCSLYVGAITADYGDFYRELIGEGLCWRVSLAGSLALIGILSLLGASHLAVALVNWLATLLATPHPLPRMDFSKGIPPESRTLAVVPTMLISAQNIEDLIEALEVRFLANQDENLHFGLLTDFRDADEETTPEDEPLLRLARQKIEELNKKYRRGKGDTFFLFHRPRRWNPQERIWMGYERKTRKACGIEFASARRLRVTASRLSLVTLQSYRT